MAKLCSKCGGTGVMVDDNYCKCADGKLKKAMDAAKAIANTKMEEEKLKALQTDLLKQADPKINANEVVENINKEYKKKIDPTFSVGDWVEDKQTEIIGIIDKIDHGDVRFMARYKKDKPKEVLKGQSGWINIRRIKPAPLEAFDDFDFVDAKGMLDEMAHKFNIDRALDAGDKELFKKLVGGNGND